MMRSDFFYRLNGFEIKLPPLRERREDIPLLVDFFVARFYENNHTDLGQKFFVPNDVKKKFMSYDWPGNVRELQHAVMSYLSLRELPKQHNPAPVLTPKQLKVISPPPERHASAKESFEKNKIIEALQKYDWNLDSVSSFLGVSKRTIYRKIAKYRLV